MKTLITLVLILSACNNLTVETDINDASVDASDDMTTGGNSTITSSTGGNGSTGGNATTGGMSNASSTVINGITVHSDMSGYTYSCFSSSQLTIACMPTLSEVTPNEYKYCTTMLSRDCNPNPATVYECYSC